MEYGERTSENLSRQRAWHRQRAITRKVLRSKSLLAVDRMTEAQLWTAIEERLYHLEDRISDGSDVQMARDVVDARAIVRELKMRGVQLSLALLG